MSSLELRDPIHHRIPFDAFERRVIDHPFFQRLRFISQLSFLQTYAYPGATHARFSHSLGAMHVAGRLFAKMIAGSEAVASRLSTEQLESLRRRVRLAGLLHDIGHGPFSHESESVFPPFSTLPLDRSWWKPQADRRSTHEDYTVLLLQTLAEEGVLERDLARDVASLVHGEVTPSAWLEDIDRALPTCSAVLKRLISGEVDCDRMDYLLRDSYFCGVAYGNYDLDWLISSLGVVEHEGRLVIAIAENGMRAFESFLLARYHMFDQVYFHKTKAGFIHYLEQAIVTGEIPLVIPTDPYAYADVRDGAVIEMMFRAARDEKNYWSRHLVRRLPARRILRLNESRPEDARELSGLVALCGRHAIRYFTHSVGKELTSLDRTDTSMFVAKQTLRGLEYVPAFRYSDLLQKYNERLRFTDFFVWREDVARFEAVSKEKGP